MEALRVRVLGGFEVDGLDTARLGSRKARILGKVLALARSKPVTTEFLADCVGPEGRRSSAADGTWPLVEPFAADDVRDNLIPIGRVFYSASTLICTPATLSQEVGAALGTRAGEARRREVGVLGVGDRGKGELLTLSRIR